LSHQVKKNDGDCDQFVDDEPFFDERKPSSTTIAKSVLNNGEHTLIPVKMKTIHSTIREFKRFLLNDGQPLHMVKFVGAIRNSRVCTKYVQIDVEDGTGFLRGILWRKKKNAGCSVG
jgi:hypothetical protein